MAIPVGLTDFEKYQAHLMAKNEWGLLSYRADSGISIYVRKDENGIIHIREDQPVQPIIDENKALANQWDGWKGKTFGAVVSRIPTVIYNRLKKECGFDGVQYDQKAMNKKLNSSDYAYLRTGGGRL